MPGLAGGAGGFGISLNLCPQLRSKVKTSLMLKCELIWHKLYCASLRHRLQADFWGVILHNEQGEKPQERDRETVRDI
jgi:hypothetical protein